MFDFPGDKLIKAQRERLQDQMMGSYKNPETLIKGLSQEDFNSQYPETKFERYSFESLSKAKTELKKGENFDEQAFDLETSKMKPVVVQNEGKKKLMYVREKAV
jgi:hypothetical protein